jgi:hypothetical protein
MSVNPENRMLGSKSLRDALVVTDTSATSTGKPVVSAICAPKNVRIAFCWDVGQPA